jgi:hypothetical protein
LGNKPTDANSFFLFLLDFRLEAAMTRLTRLKQQARESATLLGHRLGRFRRLVITVDPPAPASRPGAAATCEICGAMVVVDPSPAVPDEAVTGEGVNHRCGVLDQEGHETA